MQTLLGEGRLVSAGSAACGGAVWCSGEAMYSYAGKPFLRAYSKTAEGAKRNRQEQQANAAVIRQVAVPA